MSNEGPILTVTDLSYDLAGQRLLDGLSFTIGAGRHTVIAGPNGAGKSTLLKLLAGDLRYHDGRVLLDGRELRTWTLPQLAARRAVMPQESRLTFAFTVEEVVRLGRHRLALGRDSGNDAAVERALSATDTLHLRHRLFPTLSGGEKARVTFARVLAQESSLLFLDEPTASLDPKHQHLLMGLVRDLVSRGASVITVLHDLNLTAVYADELVVLKHGRLRAAGPVTEVLTKELLEDAFESRFELVTNGEDVPLVLSLPQPRAL